MDEILVANSLTKEYRGVPPVTALKSASLSVGRGERVAILGKSGAGKSTLLNILGLLDEPTSGTYELFGLQTTQLRSRERDRLRAKAIGFVFQAYHVIGHRTVRENILLKVATAGIPRANRAALINDAIQAVGLDHRADALGSTLSGGEKQRLAIARAVVTSPELILADEPTGNLDGTNAQAVMRLFDVQVANGVSVVVITHDDRTAAWADRVVRLESGALSD